IGGSSEWQSQFGIDSLRKVQQAERGGWASTEKWRIPLPQTRLSMRKLKEVLRLHSLGLKQQQIARSCLIAQSTVHQYLKAAAAAGVSWPLPPDWDERRLEEVVAGVPRPTAVWRKTAAPDFGLIRQQLQTHRNLTLQLAWEEYRED